MRPFDASGAFQPALDTSVEVSRLAVRGAGATIFAQGVMVAIQMIATVVLARLLTPKDFGLVTMVTTFSLLLVNFGLNGFTEAVVQRGEINNALASNLFWINIGAGLLLTALFALAGSLLARFYHDALVARVAVGVSLTIFFTSTSVQHLALLKRAMRFSVVSENDIIARSISVATSVILAWAGWGYWALVAGIVAQPLASSVGAWFLCQWIPSFPRRAAGTASMVRFAINVYGRFTVNYFARNMDNLLVGWRFNAVALGFYKKAYDLFALSGSQLVAPLAIVAVSALRRFNAKSIEYRRYLLNALAVTAFVGMGVGADLTLIGRDLIRLLLGPGWEPAGRIFTFFGPGIGVMLLYITHGWIHLSIGRADRWFRWGIVEFTLTGLLFILALPWGPVGIAMAWSASFWILTVPAFWYAGRPIQFGIRPVLAAVWKYLFASLLAGCASALVVREIPFYFAGGGTLHALVRIVSISLLFVVLYLGSVILMHRGCAPLYQVSKLLRDMVPWDWVARRSPGIAPVRESDKAWVRMSGSANPKPLVSILIPAFNSQSWIADTLRSALAQTWEPKEIIVVDDASTDQTLAIARQFESECVRVVMQKHQGAAAARNLAFALSKGEYIQWLDADDLLAPDKVARQMEVMEQCGNKRTLASSAWGRFLYRYYRAEFAPTALWCDLTPVEWLLSKMGENLYMQTATWLVSRELSEAAGPWDTRLLSDDDGEYFCRVLLASDGVRFVPEARMYYRSFGYGTLSYVGQSEPKIDAHWLSMKLHIGYLRSLEDSQRVRAACLKYLQTCLINFYPEKRDIVKQAEQIAMDLGGQMRVPSLSWKYSWSKVLLGWGAAKRFAFLMRRIRWCVQEHLDRTLYRLEKRALTADLRTRDSNHATKHSSVRAGF